MSIDTSIQTTNTSSFGSELGANLAFSGIMSGGFGSITAVRNHGGIRKAFSATRENNKLLKEYAKALGPETDVFTKNIKTAYNYQSYTRLAKQRAKLERKIAKLPLSDRIKNIFRGDNKVTTDTYKTKLAEFDATQFDPAVAKLKRGESISEEVLRTSRTKIEKQIARLDETGKLPFGEKIKNIFRKNKVDTQSYKAKLNNKAQKLSATGGLEAAKTFRQSTKGLLKSELKDPMGIFFAATETFSRISAEAIPAFKNEGVIAGLKATGKALVAGVATWITDAGFSVVFRTVGATVGSVFGPVGSAIGSLVGNAVGGLLSCKLVQKIFPVKEQPQEVAQQMQEVPAQIAQQEQIQTVEQIPQQAQTQAEAGLNQQQEVDIATKYANLPSKEQVKQMAYAQAFKGKEFQLKGYYA